MTQPTLKRGRFVRRPRSIEAPTRRLQAIPPSSCQGHDLVNYPRVLPVQLLDSGASVLDPPDASAAVTQLPPRSHATRHPSPAREHPSALQAYGKATLDQQLQSHKFVLNGVTGDSAQPGVANRQEDKRVLRSQDVGASRVKSDLCQFFPDYEEVLFGAAREEALLDANSTLFVTDKPSKSQDLPIRASLSPQKPHNVTTPRKSSTPGTNGATQNSPSPSKKAARDSAVDNAEISRVDLSRFRHDALKIEEDPLPDDAFIPTHKRAERKEKNLRNIEKEHAMFEKGQLERLLDGLRGPDWLKVMGLTGITDGEKRTFEAKRDHFVQGVRSLLRKFDSWKEQERELKFGRELAPDSAAADDDDDDDEADADDDEDDADEMLDEERGAQSGQEEYPDDASIEINADASAAQLLQETKASGRPNTLKKAKQTTMDRFLLQIKKPEVVEDTRPIASFYKKRYMRDAALSTRRKGRVVLAFGEPLPEPSRREFDLPDDVLSPDVLASNARRRRLLKRKTSPD